ncbi:zonular occludens toxin domain-containing protein [Halomonas sp. JS92-SW72]|uniref:zonular occludens toxin domain-containing protein n=1 Tax=Halomonas sp. JS92-SW72 TaxID=2306583 RepID=UPI000E5AA6EA|nr:zonular occludens toxin domain-containing protein [Halomonas sp. JS92-SW72]AXY43789.1 hypothetical protein D1793_17165 [Halomonas sp. JS92-SW72]
MSIHLISGVPGAGKTLRAVYTMVNLLRTEEGADRPFFGNVNGLRNQAPIPEEWMDVPDGAIILIDEVQQRWRRYRNTGTPPPEIAALETHRHRGIDFIITCQNPSQLTSDVRALVDTHEHLMRRGKLNGAIVWRWEGNCHTNPASHAKDADCEVSVWRYPKWLFDQYQSATLHTGKRRLPRILVIAPVVFLGAAASVAYAVNSVTGFFGDSSADTAADTANPQATIAAPQLSRPTVTAYGGLQHADLCRLFDQEGRPLLVSRPMCLEALDMGLPYDVEILDL